MKSRQGIIKKAEELPTKDLIIRSLYRELAPFFQRDTNFFYLDDDSMYDMYMKGMPMSDTYVICETICIYYKELFTNFKIDSKIISMNNNRSVPHFAMLVKGDNGWYFIDPLKDLMNNQVGLKTGWYGVLPNQKYSEVVQRYPYISRLPDEYIKTMDGQLGILPTGEYANAYFDDLHYKLTTNKAKIELVKYVDGPIIPNDRDNMVMNKLDFFNKSLINYAYIPGPIERGQYYGYVCCKIFNKSEKGLITTHCVKENNFELTYASREGDIKFVEKFDTSINGYQIKRI